MSVDLWTSMQDPGLPPIPGLPFEDWKLPSPYDDTLTPGGWAALEECVAPGRGGLYLYQKGRVGRAVAGPSFVVFSIHRRLYIGHAGRILRMVWLSDSDERAFVEAVSHVARAIAADPEIGEKMLTPRAEVQPEPAAGADPAWDQTVRYLAIAYRARALDGGTWAAIGKDIVRAAHRARDLIRMAEQEPEPIRDMEPPSNVISFARKRAATRKASR